MVTGVAGQLLDEQEPVCECEPNFVGPEALGALLEFTYTATLTTSSANTLAVFQATWPLEIPCHCCLYGNSTK